MSCGEPVIRTSRKLGTRARLQPLLKLCGSFAGLEAVASHFLKCGFVKYATAHGDYTHNPLNEYYKKGCQEKTPPRPEWRFFLEIQPTVVTLLWRSLACCPFS